jgi:membrane fusion protein (multidrug efflux system)
MDTSKKIIIAVSIIFILVVAIISGRMILNNIIQKKINQVNPTEIIAQEVQKSEFYEKIETFGTALANQSFSIRIKKTDLISSLEFDKNLIVQKNQLIAQLKTEKITAPFSGRLGVREITPGILGGEDSIIATLDDIETVNIDIKIPESYLNILKKDLKIKASSEAFKEVFYGNLETEIQATIYEMKYKINLSSSEFLVSQNPTWTFGTKSYVTEIALLDENEDILVMSKLQSPVLRQGIQQYVIKLDF